MNIVFCSSEVVPYAKTGGMADVCGALPQALEKLGVEIKVIMPLYRKVDLYKYKVKLLPSGYWKAQLAPNVDIYFIENKRYFDRAGIYGDPRGDYPDNFDRFLAFCDESLLLLKDLKIPVDIIHCHDWHTGLIPLLLKYKYANSRFFSQIRTVFTIHNLAYQGIFPMVEYSKMGLRNHPLPPPGMEFFGKISFLKSGITFSDMITTVSPGYAKEILTKEFGCGLDDVLRKRKNQLQGILNGIDYDVWNSQTDPLISKTYSPEHTSGKQANKKKVQEFFRLSSDRDVPLFGFVARLAQQKGLDIIAKIMDDFMKLDVQLIFMGDGDEQYKHLLLQWKNRYPEKVAVYLGFEESVAHEVYSGCDLFLMPSVFEPCGLSQMISLRYGTIPIVSNTGGLADTIKNFDGREAGNGFVFDPYEPKPFMEAIKESVRVYKKKPLFEQLMQNAFNCNFSWEKSAQAYAAMYQQMLDSIPQRNNEKAAAFTHLFDSHNR